MDESAKTPADMTDREIYRAYLNNAHKSEELQSEILKGAREGVDPCVLLVKACRAISAMTGSQVFTEQVERSLLAVYGESLGVIKPLEMELDETRERLERIRQAVEHCDQIELRDSMNNAIRSHMAKIERLENEIRQAKEDAASKASL